MIYKTTKEILESLSPFISENDVSVSNEEHGKEDGSGKEIGDKVDDETRWVYEKRISKIKGPNALLMSGGK